ncbi:chitobiase/beta-hexosaminidase C-terminal domain-containing protein [Sodaliphilus sp.]|uniref:chitobiase/beta-hexosaminidase C-terminal domain-containing protein n=1 Tax=Sodaliphilus sp. TaxID=2815818 RepID=UPI00388FB915
MKKFLSFLMMAMLFTTAFATEATMAAGTNGSSATVNDQAAIKCGTSSKSGDMTITVGAGATELTFYAAAWNGVENSTLTITPEANVSVSEVTLTPNTGIAGNSPFTLADGTDEEDYKFTITLTGVTAETTFTLAGTKRFVVWNASYTAGEAPVVTVATPVINGTTPFEDETEVTISCSTSGASIYYTLDGSDPSNQSTEYTGAFDLNATTTVKAIAYLDGTASSIATKEFVAKQVANVANVAEFNALADGTEFKFTGRLVVSAQTGKYLYAQDATGGMLLFGTAPAYSSEDVIPAGFKGTKTTFNGAPEATDLTGLEAATETQEIEAKVLKVTEVANNLFIAAIIEDVLIDTDAKTFVTEDGEVAYYDRFKVEFPTDGEFYTVSGVTGYYNAPQFMPLAFAKVEPALAKIIGVSIKGQEVEMEEGVEFAFLDLTEAFTAEDVFVTTMNAEDCTVVVEVKDGWLEATNDYTVQISLLDNAGETVDRFDVFVTVTTEDPITGINDINAASANVVKMIENGQVVIVKGDKKFNVAGQTVK